MKRENFLEILDRKGQVKCIYQNGRKRYFLVIDRSLSIEASGESYCDLVQRGEEPFAFICFRGEMDDAAITKDGISIYIWELGHQFEILMEWKDIKV